MRKQPESRFGRRRAEAACGREADGHGQMSVLAAAARAAKGKEAPIPAVDEETLSLYPTAAQCGQCHKQIYEEWSSSNHAYASISPMFHAFEQKFQELTKGTVGTFCVRCHQQVGTQLGENRETPLWARSPISREGVTCITCHRVKEQYGKVNGERRVEPGKIFEPVYGSGEKSVIEDILADKETYSVKTSKDGRGTDIHNGMMTNPQLTKSEFCVSCHQVAVNLGIKLEIVWDQYRDSPARNAGVTCQNCHMGKVPGKPEGYSTAPSAVVGGKEINPGRRHANHRFIGPGLFHRASRHLSSQPEGPGLQHQGMAAIRLARRLGHQRVREQGRTRQDQDRTFPSAGPMRSTVRTRADHRGEPREARRAVRVEAAGHGERHQGGRSLSSKATRGSAGTWPSPTRSRTSIRGTTCRPAPWVRSRRSG